MVASSKRRASGDTGAVEVANEQADAFDKPQSEETDTERMRQFDFPGFSRMRTDWGSDRNQIMRINSLVNGRILEVFSDVYSIMYELYEVVREPEVDQNGEIRRDQFGMVMWRRSSIGGYYEDWSKMTDRQREAFLFKITTGLFEWEQRAADLWTEAMFAKAKWQEHFAAEFDAPLAGTVDDRTQRGNLNAAEDRYFALFLSSLSRRAEAICRNQQLLAQRLKDTFSA